MIERLYTIGVYGSTEESFFDALVEARIDLFCDVRQRRGLRGKRYAYANSTYLQEKLATLHIDYLHIKALAPTQAIRDLQKQADSQSKVLKRDRQTLSDAYVSAYNQQILANFDVQSFLKRVENRKNVCFFCVERHPDACHRSLIVAKLKEEIHVELTNLVP